MPEFEIKMECTVVKTVTVQCETEEEAMKRPWDHCIHEVETDMIDWDVQSIECTEQE